MSGLWTKGPVCGVDNCQSTFWRKADGQSVCRNGHVRAGDLDIQDDEEDYVQTRKLALPKAARSAEPKSRARPELYGADRQEYLFRALQAVLIRQLDWLVAERGVDAEVRRVAQQMWQLSLAVYTKTDLIDSHPSRHIQTKMATATLLRPLAICFVACNVLRVPITAAEFVEAVAELRLPYLRVGALLAADPAFGATGPVSLQNELAPRDVPTDEFYYEVETVAWIVAQFGVELPIVGVALELFQCISHLALPIELWHVAQSVAELVKFKLKYPNCGARPADILYHSKLLGLLLVAFDIWWLGSDSPHFNTSAWLSVLKDLHDDGQLADFSVASPGEVPWWSSAKMDKYLDWFQHRFLELSFDSARLEEDRAEHGRSLYHPSRRKLYRLFALDGQNGVAGSEAEQGEEKSREAEVLGRAYGKLNRTGGDDSGSEPETMEFMRGILIQRLGDQWAISPAYIERGYSWAGTEVQKVLQ